MLAPACSTFHCPLVAATSSDAIATDSILRIAGNFVVTEHDQLRDVGGGQVFQSGTDVGTDKHDRRPAGRQELLNLGRDRPA